MRGCWAQHHLVAGGAAPRIFWGVEHPMDSSCGKRKGNKEEGRRNGKSTKFQCCREEEEGTGGGTSCSNPAPEAATISWKTGEKGLPCFVGFPYKAFPPAYSQNIPSCPSLLQFCPLEQLWALQVLPPARAGNHPWFWAGKRGWSTLGQAGKEPG